MAFPISRPTSPPAFYPSWDAYLQHWREYDGTTFCSAIAEIYHPVLRKALDHVDAQIEQASKQTDGPKKSLQISTLKADRASYEATAGLPWITPVLGTGCLSLFESDRSLQIEGMPALIAAEAGDWGTLPDGTTAAESIRLFSTALVKSKLGGPQHAMGPTDDFRESTSGPETVDRRSPQSASTPNRALAARVTLCAKLLTQLYFESGALVIGSIPGQANDTIVINTDLAGDTPAGAEILDRLIAPLKAQLKSLENDIDPNDKNLKFIRDFAHAVLEDLPDDRPKVSGSDAALMSEIAWNLMTVDTSQYPGWSDLLTKLTVASESASRTQRWPHLKNVSEARKFLHQQFIDTTVASWASRLPSRSKRASATRSVRDQLYDAIAQLLIAQANLQEAKLREGADKLPPAVAFVTSFDLELEMALLEARTDFRLVVPFYVRTKGSSSDAQAFVWLQTTIKAIPDDKALTASDLYKLRVTREWTLLTTSPEPEDDDLSLPIVVRVAGCPLIKVAGFGELSEAEKKYEKANEENQPWVKNLRTSLGDQDTRISTLAGTVLLDEYTSLHHWAAELAPIPLRSTKPEDRLGLPTWFFKGFTERDARFWFVLGVQLNDEAVRHRTAAIVGTADLRSHIHEEPRTAERAGVVVNRRTTPNERDIFLWQELDVVAADYEDVLPALRHMAKHAESAGLRRTNEGCKVDGGAV